MKALRNSVEHHKAIRKVKQIEYGRRCDCGEKSTHKIEYATSFFRGEDEQVFKCDKHTIEFLQDPFKTKRII